MKLLALLLLLAAAPTPEQFDLICKGQETIRYRVDLARGEWCWEDCRGTNKIAAVTSTRITFKDEDTPSGRALAFVDRVSGEWFQSSVGRYGASSNRGTCSPAPFSGFGEGMRQF